MVFNGIQWLIFVRVDFGPITACLIHRVTRRRGYSGACVGLPNPTFCREICHHSNRIKLHKVQESAAFAVVDKYHTRLQSKG